MSNPSGIFSKKPAGEDDDGEGEDDVAGTRAVQTHRNKEDECMVFL